jgi:integral membrane sensor domain MASE1
MSYLFTKEQGILKDQKKGLMMKKHLIFLVFIVMVYFLALVVKINNDHKKKGQALKKLELVEKQIH